MREDTLVKLITDWEMRSGWVVLEEWGGKSVDEQKEFERSR